MSCSCCNNLLSTGAFRLDPLVDCVPIVSTSTNLIHLLEKLVMNALLKAEILSEKDIIRSHYYHGIRHKSARRCCVLLFPFAGNIILFIYTMVNWRSYSDRREFIWDMSGAMNDWGHSMLYLSNHYANGKGVEANQELADYWKQKYNQSYDPNNNPASSSPKAAEPSPEIEIYQEDLKKLETLYHTYQRQVENWQEVSPELKENIQKLLQEEFVIKRAQRTVPSPVISIYNPLT